MGAARLLAAQRTPFAVCDRQSLSPEIKSQFQKFGAEVFEGQEDPNIIPNFSRIVISPGISGKHPLVLSARALGIPVITEIDLGLSYLESSRVIAITGTNGKSTTTVMVEHILRAAGKKVVACGNLGEPVSAVAATPPLPDFLSLELSSYQLESCAPIPAVSAAITSFSHDHLARHGSMEEYFRCKWGVFAGLRSDGVGVVTSDVAKLAEKMRLTFQGQRLWVIGEGSTNLPSSIHVQLDARAQYVLDSRGAQIMDLRGLPFNEWHNRQNGVFAALLTSQILGDSPESLLGYLTDFVGLPHRCELIGKIGGEPVINDSKSTNVESTLIALRSHLKPVVLLMGGQGKGESYSPIAARNQQIKSLVTFGASGEEIAKDCRTDIPTRSYRTLAEAFANIEEWLCPGSVHLFSPGCASFDEFRNFEHRGEFFKRAMQPHLDT